MVGHKVLKVTRLTKSIKKSSRYVRKRCYRVFDEGKFKEEVSQISWYELYLCEDLDQAVQIFTTSLTKILDRLAPVRTIQIRTKYAPWLSSSTKALIRERDQAQVLAAESGDQDD